MMHPPNSTDTSSRLDVLTIASIAVVVYALANVIHEAMGHGLTCILAGGKALVLSSVHFEGDTGSLSPWANRLVSAGGSLANFAAAALTLAAMARTGHASARWRYGLWLFFTVNTLQACGYFFFSGVSGIGDWAAVIDGLPGHLAWRILLGAGGGALYFGAVMYALRLLDPFLGNEPVLRYRRGTTLALVPYLTGGALYLAAGLLNPVGMVLVFISALAASFGGTSGLAWGPQMLRGETPPGSSADPWGVTRHGGWVLAAVLAGGAYVWILGPGIRFH